MTWVFSPSLTWVIDSNRNLSVSDVSISRVNKQIYRFRGDQTMVLFVSRHKGKIGKAMREA